MGSGVKFYCCRPHCLSFRHSDTRLDGRKALSTLLLVYSAGTETIGLLQRHGTTKDLTSIYQFCYNRSILDETYVMTLTMSMELR